MMLRTPAWHCRNSNYCYTRCSGWHWPPDCHLNLQPESSWTPSSSLPSSPVNTQILPTWKWLKETHGSVEKKELMMSWEVNQEISSWWRGQKSRGQRTSPQPAMETTFPRRVGPWISVDEPGKPEWGQRLHMGGACPPSAQEGLEPFKACITPWQCCMPSSCSLSHMFTWLPKEQCLQVENVLPSLMWTSRVLEISKFSFRIILRSLSGCSLKQPITSRT